MAVILHIETSAETCSAALSDSGQLLMSRCCSEGMSHATQLPVFIEEFLQFARACSKVPDAVAVSAGPGSYTGLRIGVSTAKGLCYGFGAKLIAIDTLQLIAKAARSKNADKNVLFCPMVDARRMEVYTALYDQNLQKIGDSVAKIIDENAFSEILEHRKVCFCGNGAAKCKEIIKHRHAIFIDEIVPFAENMVALAETKFAAGQFEDVAYFEPFYVKEFYTTAKKND